MTCGSNKYLILSPQDRIPKDDPRRTGWIMFIRKHLIKDNCFKCSGMFLCWVLLTYQPLVLKNVTWYSRSQHKYAYSLV